MTNYNAVDLHLLYEKPLPSSRIGPLYNAFSYPTKISPEAIAVFIATHTQPGAVLLDAFAGSGTAGLATLLCDRPTDAMKHMAAELGMKPKWGPREAHLFEIGVLGSFVARTLCNPPDPEKFTDAVAKLLAQAQAQAGWIYAAKSPEGTNGCLRHVIWSDILICYHCQTEIPYWDATVRRNPLRIGTSFSCPSCQKQCFVDTCTRAMETVEDDLTGGMVERKKRTISRVYGQSGAIKWQREPTDDDRAVLLRTEVTRLPTSAPNMKIAWGDLHRTGYHKGITCLHHFYTRRNFLVISILWELACSFPEDVRDALCMLILSYNSTHSTLMTRVVVKKGQRDFVLSGAQSGVLYISGLPVEKNIFKGIAKKAKTFNQAFALVHGTNSKVTVHNASSEKMPLPDASIDYVFTDPPFGDYIPYAEINQINELWLGSITDRTKEIIVSNSQGKSVDDYGRMMGSVFKEISRLLKSDGLATVVFHSAKADVWRALSGAYGGAGLRVEATSVLDKLQDSFKQIVSDVSVKGDLLLLLSKGAAGDISKLDPKGVANEIMMRALKLDPDEMEPQRLYSRFVSRCLELGIDVRMDAREFYGRTSETLGESA